LAVPIDHSLRRVVSSRWAEAEFTQPIREVLLIGYASLRFPGSFQEDRKWGNAAESRQQRWKRS
jgi:hypothetical protein